MLSLNRKIFLTIIFHCLFLCTCISLMSENAFRTEPFYYTYNSKLNKFDFSKPYDSIKTYAEKKALIEKLLTLIEKKYYLKIDITYVNQDDEKGNTLSGCIVNIKTEKLDTLFSGQGHASFIIETVCLNILQPLTRKWEFQYLFLKLNGTYANFIDYDRQYATVLTAEHFQAENNFNWETYPKYLKK